MRAIIAPILSLVLAGCDSGSQPSPSDDGGPRKDQPTAQSDDPQLTSFERMKVLMDSLKPGVEWTEVVKQFTPKEFTLVLPSVDPPPPPAARESAPTQYTQATVLDELAKHPEHQGFVLYFEFRDEARWTCPAFFDVSGRLVKASAYSIDKRKPLAAPSEPN